MDFRERGRLVGVGNQGLLFGGQGAGMGKILEWIFKCS
jgi:hypothetical protein